MKLLNNLIIIFKETDIIRPEICNGLKNVKYTNHPKKKKLTNILANVKDYKLLSKKENIKL